MLERLKKNPICYLAMRMWQFGEGRRRTIVVTLVASACAMAIWLTIPLVMARFINRAQQAASDDSLIECAMLLALSVVIGVIAWAFHGPSRIVELITSVSVRRNMQTTLLTKVTRLPMQWHTEHHSGETIDRVTKAGSALAEFSEASFLVIQVFGKLIGALVMMTIFMPAAAVIVVVSTIVALVMIVAFDRKLVPLYESGNSVLNQVASKVQDYLTNITTVISLRLGDRVIQEVDQQLARFDPIVRRSSTLNEAKWFITNVLVDLTRAVTLFLFVAAAVRGGRVVELGTLVALNEYLTALGNSFFEFTWKWGEFIVKATRLRAIEEMERDYDALVGDRSSTRLPTDWKEIRLSGVSYRHDTTGERNAGISDIELTLERGKSYAVIGASGGGKSTLLSVLRGLNHAQTGSVYCDGCLVEDGLVAVSHHTTLIPQEPEVFADSVLKNVTMGIEAPVDKVLHAIEIAQFSPVLTHLPKGLETNIAEKGVSLSGGQKQRLALARGIFFAFDSDSEILLLDESTSSVDFETEEEIYRALTKHFRSELIVATTHRLKLLPLFDEIIVVQAGKIIEKGTFNDLHAAGGVFATMWQRHSDSASASLQEVHA